MSARLNRNRLCLCLLAKTDPARAIIEKGNENLVRSLCERAHNILKGTADIQDWVSDEDAPENNNKRKQLAWYYSHAKRLSPLLNTLQNPMGEKRDILRLSTQKRREMQHPQLCLRRFVLVNNTLR